MHLDASAASRRLPQEEIAPNAYLRVGTGPPVRKPEDRDLYIREHDYNNQVSSLRVPVECAVANLKTWRILFTDYRRPLKTFLSSFHAATGLYFFKLGFA
jgi:hypothetical protein